MPSVSVVMTLYNSERFIGEAIESVLAQTYTDREIIVIDDGSTDGSAAVVQRFGGVVRYEYQPNRGAAAATNAGVRLSSGEYIAFLESDDVWQPAMLADKMAVFESRPEIGAVNNDLQYVSEQGVVEHDLIRGWRPDESFARTFLKGFNFMLSSLMLRRSAFAAAGPFDEGFVKAGFQDIEWYARLMQVTTVHYIPRPLTLFRRHGDRIPDEIQSRNERYLLDRLWERFQHDPLKRRYLLHREVGFVADVAKRKLARGELAAGRAGLRSALALAFKERVAPKMALRSALRLLRSYLGAL
jgi:glycosyltransferase involved in cell wall biosynthesis